VHFHCVQQTVAGLPKMKGKCMTVGRFDVKYTNKVSSNQMEEIFSLSSEDVE